jgi:glycosyltransferase involved in cell wall biosynthesis
MKIAYFHGTAIPSRAASTVQVMKMCEAFAALGHEVVLFVPSASDVLENDFDVYDYYGVKRTFKIFFHCWFTLRSRRFRIPGRGYFDALRLAYEIKKIGPDLVYSRFALAGLIAAYSGVRVMHELHRPLSHLASRDARLTKLVLQHRRMVRAVTISSALMKQYLIDTPQIERKLFVAHDAASINSDPANIDPSTREFRVGYVGSLFPGRGIELIMSVARECTFARFHIVGGSKEEVARYDQELKGLSNVYMHGYQPNAVAMKMLKEFDVVLAPYGSKVSVYGDADADTSAFMSPLKLFEYMAAGKAIICSDHEVLKEVVTHEVTALICPRENIAAWVGALRRLWHDVSLRNSLGGNARKVCENNYTWKIRAERILNFKKRI